MNTKKLIELTKRHREIEQQVADLELESRAVEGDIEDLVRGGGRLSAPSPAPRKKRRNKKKSKKPRGGYKRKTPGGDEIDALAGLIKDHFKKNPDTEISPVEIYDALGLQNAMDKSRTRSALTKLRKGRYIALVRRGVYVLQQNQPGGHRVKASKDEEQLMAAMDPGKGMRVKDILARVNPPKHRYHTLENRLWMMAQAGKLERPERGIYKRVK